MMDHACGTVFSVARLHLELRGGVEHGNVFLRVYICHARVPSELLICDPPTLAEGHFACGMNQDFHFGPGAATVYTRAGPNSTSFPR